MPLDGTLLCDMFSVVKFQFCHARPNLFFPLQRPLKYMFGAYFTPQVRLPLFSNDVQYYFADSSPFMVASNVGQQVTPWCSQQGGRSSGGELALVENVRDRLAKRALGLQPFQARLEEYSSRFGAKQWSLRPPASGGLLSSEAG